jgi:hypothetical protein
MSGLLLALLIYAILLQVVDCYTTYVGLTRHSNVSEGNKVAAWLFDKIGMLPTMIGVKGILIASMIYVAVTAPYLWWIIALAAAWFTFIAVNNIKVLRSGK